MISLMSSLTKGCIPWLVQCGADSTTSYRIKRATSYGNTGLIRAGPTPRAEAITTVLILREIRLIRSLLVRVPVNGSETQKRLALNKLIRLAGCDKTYAWKCYRPN
jgi:hypothetical protein